MANDPVILINAFEVPQGQDEQFLAGWERSREVLRAQPGYLSTRLHRSLAPEADFRYVNVARWESAAAFRAATARPEFRAQTPPYRFHAALYEVVREDG
jgi:heme oxygenase (mycobilin-producing)